MAQEPAPELAEGRLVRLTGPRQRALREGVEPAVVPGEVLTRFAMRHRLVE